MTTVGLIALALAPMVFIVLFAINRDTNSGDPVVAEGTLTDIGQTETTSGSSSGSSSAPSSTLPDGAPASDDSSTSTSTSGDVEVGVVVESLGTTSTTAWVATPTTQNPRVSGTTVAPPGTQQSTSSTTTVSSSTTSTTAVNDPIGICVFADGSVASGIRQSTCKATFTTDAAEARRISEERRLATTTTTTEPTTTTKAEPTTTTTVAVSTTTQPVSTTTEPTTTTATTQG